MNPLNHSLSQHGVPENLPEVREQPRYNSRMEMVGRLTATVLHEMRNPLSVIKGYAELMARDGKNAQDPHLQALLKGVDRLNGIMECVLSVVRTPHRTQATADVKASMDLAKEFVLMAHRPQPVITVNLPEGLPEAKIGPTDLEQVLLNLLMNACDATDPDPQVSIDVAFAQEGVPAPSREAHVISTTPESRWETRWPWGKPAITIAVRDRGSGVAPDVMEVLFRDPITTKRRRQGTGLGLLLCRDILTARDGTLTMESEPDAGTTATVIVPVAAATRSAPSNGNGSHHAQFP